MRFSLIFRLKLRNFEIHRQVCLCFFMKIFLVVCILWLKLVPYVTIFLLFDVLRIGLFGNKTRTEKFPYWQFVICNNNFLFGFCDIICGSFEFHQNVWKDLESLNSKMGLNKYVITNNLPFVIFKNWIVFFLN